MAKDVDRFLLDYFHKNLGKGYTVESLKFTLLSQGYLRSDIDRVVEIIQEKSRKAKQDVEMKELEKKQAVQSFHEEEKQKPKGFFGRLFG
jgi:uncharacterized protein Smg (DUF494 family)